MTYPKYKLGEEVVREIRVPPTYSKYGYFLMKLSHSGGPQLGFMSQLAFISKPMPFPNIYASFALEYVDAVENWC